MVQLYNPIKFSDFLGNQTVVNFVKKLLLSNYEQKIPLPDKLVFCGNPHSGQEFLKRIVVASILCSNREVHSCEPCGKCLTCDRIFNGKGVIDDGFCEFSDTGISYTDKSYFSLRFNKIGAAEFADYFIERVSIYCPIDKELLKTIYFMCGNFNNAIRFLESVTRLCEVPYKDLLENGTILTEILKSIKDGDFVCCMNGYKKSLAWFGSFEAFIQKFSEFIGFSMISFLNIGGGDLSFFIEISRNIQWIYDSYKLDNEGMAEIFFTKCVENKYKKCSKMGVEDIKKAAGVKSLENLLTK